MKVFSICMIISFLALAAALAFQVLEMKTLFFF
mgnify:CR=1 FL=1